VSLAASVGSISGSVTSDMATRRVSAGIASRYGMYVAGEWVDAESGAITPSIDPTTEQPIADVAQAGEADVARAVEVAKGAVDAWVRLGWQGRAERLRAFADRLAEDGEQLARIDAVDGGIPVDGMAKDVGNAVNTIRYFAGIASEVKGQTIESAVGSLNITLREPYGVVGRIVPFNHPIQFAASGVAAPLAAGNTVVLKPGDTTPLSALRMAELSEGILPSGVLNVLPGGLPAGVALVAHPDVPRIAFTGSTRSGQAVARGAAENLKAVTLELGGKNPLIVFPNADVKGAAAAGVVAMNFNRGQGQSCGSPSRMLVHESVREEFLDELLARIGDLTIGDPLEKGIAMGPLAFEAHYHRVLGFIEKGLTEGGRLAAGGAERPSGTDAGYFVAPTVFDGITPEMTIAREEIFGPVVSVISWSDPEEVLRVANELPVGLTANIWTNDLARAIDFGRRIHAGYVWVNGNGARPLGAPFGGYKLSGMGNENSLEELLSFTRTKNLSLQPAPGAAR
jgi:betaine-aldehyde dehydrogenase